MLRVRLFLASNRKEVRFFFLFVLYFVLGQLFLHLIASHTAYFLMTHNAKMSSRIINILTPAEKSSARGNQIKGPKNFTLNIKKGCDGMEGILLVTAAICAFYMEAKKKILGILTGSLIIYLSNLLRIIALYYTLKYHPGMFDVMHIYIGQIIIILIGVVFFITWAGRFKRFDEQTS